MGLLDFFARKKAVSASPAVLEAAADRRVSFMPLIATPSEAFNPRIRDAFVEVQSGTYGWIYAHQPAVRTVIDYIARNAAQLGLSLYERVGDNDRKEVGDHPAAESLRYPNPRQRTRALVYNLAIEWLIFDNAYALIVEGEAGRVQLLPVPAPRVGVLGPENYSVDAYRIWRRDGTWFDWPTESMLHWAGFDPDDPRRGVSRLETLRQLLAEDRASQAANTEVLQSGLLKPGYLKRPLDAPPLDVADATRIVEDWQAAIKAPGRRTAMLEEGTEFEDFGITPRDAEMLEGRRFTREEVSAIYGMDTCPPENAEDRQIFFSDVLQPLMRLFCETLDRSVLEQQYGLTDHYFQAGLDEQMESEKLKALTAASGRPVLLTDEARAALDLPPVEGGDELVTPANVIVGSNPKPSPMVMPIQDPNKPEQDGSFRQEALTNGHTKQLEVTNEPRRDADRRRQMRYIDEMKALLARHYARQRKTLVSPTANKAAGDAALWLRWTEELGRDLVKLLKSITDREANIYVSRLGGVDFDMREVDHYLTAMAEGTADGINGATQRDIADAGTEEAFNRADMRTEVAATGIGTRATVFARKEAGRQAPNPEQRLKIWIANSERHQDLDGVTVPLEGDWGGIVPGSEPNCSCAMEVVEMEHKSFDLIETKADDEAGHFTALASVFGNVDLVGDRMMPGAFKKTLEEKRQKNAVLPIVFSHAWDDPMKFIGEADTHAVLETEEGLLVQGKLDINNGNPVADQVHKAMKKGWITDWSFGFTVRDGGEKTVKGVNEISDVDLIEAGPTLKGANPEAQLQIVKSLPAEAKELPEDVRSNVTVVVEDGAVDPNKILTADKGVQEQDPPESLPQTLDPLREQSRAAILEIATGTKATHEPTVTDEERELRRRSREAMLDLMR